MPLIEKLSSRERMEFNESLTHGEVAQLASDPDIRVLQCSAPVEANTCDLLNRNLFRRRPDIGLRVYGFYSMVCGLSTDVTRAPHGTRSPLATAEPRAARSQSHSRQYVARATRDNAACESFMKALKYEVVYRNEYRDLAEARPSIREFLEKVYNQKRLHSALGSVPPAEFARHN